MIRFKIWLFVWTVLDYLTVAANKQRLKYGYRLHPEWIEPARIDKTFPRAIYISRNGYTGWDRSRPIPLLSYSNLKFEVFPEEYLKEYVNG